jgi:hypothetical protein
MGNKNDDWRKSTFISWNCIEAGSWRKASHSVQGNCIEAGAGPGMVGVRDTKEKHLGEQRTVLEFSPATWHAFTSRVKVS